MGKHLYVAIVDLGKPLAIMMYYHDYLIAHNLCEVTTNWTRFNLISHFCTPWKRQKIFAFFVVFSGYRNEILAKIGLWSFFARVAKKSLWYFKKKTDKILIRDIYLYSSFVSLVCSLTVRELITLWEFCLTDLFMWEIHYRDCGTFTNRVFLLIFISGDLVLSRGTGSRNGLCNSSICNWPHLVLCSISWPTENVRKPLGLKVFKG